MKIEKISDDILKITLKVSDMSRWNVSKENLRPGNPETGEMFWDIIHLASEATGVNVNGCKLTVEAIEKDAETFVIFVTKRDCKDSGNSATPRRYKYRKKTDLRQDASSSLVYTFNDLNDICRFAKNNLYFCLLFDGNNSLYKHKDLYRLVVNVPPALNEHVTKFTSSVIEYGRQSENPYFYASYLAEHLSPMISKNALKILYDKL